MNDTSEATGSPEAWQTTFDHMWELYFGPEIEKRMADGRIQENPFRISFAQVLFPVDGPVRVLLNSEVRGEATVRYNRPVESGEAIYTHDLRSIETYDLPDELLDNGHFTIIWGGSGWTMSFNFLSGRAKARDMLGLADQFLQAARFSASKGHAGPAVENLFTSAELVAKAELILHRNPAVTAKSHSAVASAINKWSRHGNIDGAFVDLFNKLTQRRPNARYGDAASRPAIPSTDDCDLVEAMIEAGLATVGKSTERERHYLAQNFPAKSS